MHEALVVNRLADARISASFQAQLLDLVKQDDIASRQNWSFLIPAVAHALDPQKEAYVQPFAAVWGLLLAALRRLDHLQDGHADDAPSPTRASTSERYNLLLSYYLLATMVLDELDSDALPIGRLLRLRKLWADCLMRVASGQQVDLELGHRIAPLSADLDLYQFVVQAKTGAFFTLAFGGTATLLTDDQVTINVLSDVGTVFGMLVQYGDDLADAATQPNPTITLPRSYHAQLAQHPYANIHPSINAFWRFVYADYFRHVEQALSVLPITVRSAIGHLFTSTFGERLDEAA